MSIGDIDWLNPPKIPKCKNCGKSKGNHKAVTLNCPFNEVRRGFPNFLKDQVYEPKEPKTSKSKV
jgi:hypothetical protein